MKYLAIGCLLICVLAAPCRAAGPTPVTIIDEAAAAPPGWSDADYGEFESCVAQGLALFTRYYHRQGLSVLPIGVRARRGGIVLTLTGAPSCDGYPGVNNAHKRACVAPAWCIVNRPGGALLCLEESAIHEIGESLGKQVYDPMQGHTELVNGCALPDFVIPHKRGASFRDALALVPNQ